LLEPVDFYLYVENIDELAAACADLLPAPPEHKLWGVYEFALPTPTKPSSASAGPATPRRATSNELSARLLPRPLRPQFRTFR